jgi:hypothetical protein
MRPAKSIERKMLAESFRRLHPFQRINEYRYIGFGSIYFGDFQVIHRELGIDDMISIEKDAYARECFEFNKPYRSILLNFGVSGQILPTLDWTKRSIIWLDYDGKLDLDSLADIGTVSARSVSGTALVVSVNAHPEPYPRDQERAAFERQTGKPFSIAEYQLSKLSDYIGPKIPPGTQGNDLRGHGVATVFHRTILNEIDEQLSRRNAMLEAGDKMLWKQIGYFLYQDGALMLTVALVFFKASDLSVFEACAFEKLPFLHSGNEPYQIRVPCLTNKEIRYLNEQLPFLTATTLLKGPGIPAQDLKAYSELYRYFPSFHEIVWS